MWLCRLCGSHENEAIQARDAKAGRPLAVVLCCGCGLVQQAEFPSDEALRIYYSHHYRQDYKQTHVPKLKYVRRAGLVALERLQHLQALKLDRLPRRVLDVGAGGGEFVYLARQAGFDASGIEPNLGYSDYARQAYGVDVQTAQLGDAVAQRFDLVCLFHVFEHMADPQAVMQRLHGLLDEGGLLFIEVPNLLQKDASPHNVYFKAHLFYYCSHTLLAAASRWFEPLHVQDQGNLRVVFRKRATALDTPVCPSPAQVQGVRACLARKGWWEYLFAGGGWRKPWRRLRQAWVEKRLDAPSPRGLLDSLSARLQGLACLGLEWASEFAPALALLH